MKLLTDRPTISFPVPTETAGINRLDEPEGSIRILPSGKSCRRLLQTLHSTKARSLYLVQIDMNDVIDQD